MTDVHRRGARRGSIHAPQVTIDYDRAVQMRREQSEAFWSSGVGAIAAILLGLGLIAVCAGLPGLVVAYSTGSTIAGWVTFAVVIVAAVLFGYSQRGK